MASTFDIGSGLTCDLDRLIASRLLVQASSGLGKTRTIRRLLEQTYGKVQHLVIDPEGEYYTLREKYDYVLAAPKGGDVVAHPRYAAMLAHELLKLGASAILDIYELNPDDRQRFVQIFCSALVDAPRNLWHPTLIVLDEAHVFCPEKDESASGTAVKALASRGRKRAFCLVLATQRLAKLAKDAAAELQTKLIGGCTLDVDVKRANDELGFERKDQRLRRLEPGQFFASGRAFDVREPTLVKVGPIKTSHPEPGQQAVPVPPPTAKVRKILGKLAELPAEAEAREKSLEDLRKENAALKHQVTKSQRAAPRTEIKIVEKLVLTDKQISLLGDIFEKTANRVDRALSTVDSMKHAMADLRAAFGKLNGHGQAMPLVTTPRPAAPAPMRLSRDIEATAPDGVTLNRLAERKILAVLATHGRRTKRQLAILTGYAMKGGGFLGALSKLKKHELLEAVDRETFDITAAGRAAASGEILPSGAALIDYWMKQLNRLAEREVLRVAVEAYPHEIQVTEIAKRTQPPYEATSGSFLGAVSKVRTLGLVSGKSMIRASEELFS